MSVHSTTKLANGHLLTLVDAGPVRFDSLGPRRNWQVQERNECGTFIRHAFASTNKTEAEAWIARNAERIALSKGGSSDESR